MCHIVDVPPAHDTALFFFVERTDRLSTALFARNRVLPEQLPSLPILGPLQVNSSMLIPSESGSQLPLSKGPGVHGGAVAPGQPPFPLSVSPICSGPGPGTPAVASCYNRQLVGSCSARPDQHVPLSASLTTPIGLASSGLGFSGLNPLAHAPVTPEAQPSTLGGLAVAASAGPGVGSLRPGVKGTKGGASGPTSSSTTGSPDVLSRVIAQMLFVGSTGADNCRLAHSKDGSLSWTEVSPIHVVFVGDCRAGALGRYYGCKTRS
jgi:hypothetical protein